MTRVPARISCEDVLHFRPLALLAQVCHMFPDTELRLVRQETEIAVPANRVNPKELLAMALAAFVNGETIVIEANGGSEALAGSCLRAVLEKMNTIFSQYKPNLPETTAKSRLYAVLVEAVGPFRGDPAAEVILVRAKSLLLGATDSAHPPDNTTHAETIRLGARLHQAVIDILPSIAEHFRSPLVLSVQDEHQSGESHFDLSTMHGAQEYEILAAAPPPGARVVIRTAGDQAGPCAEVVAFVLRQLPAVDDWIRSHEHIETRSQLIAELLGFIQEATVDMEVVNQVPLPDKAVLHDLLDSGNVIVCDQEVSKVAALQTLVDRHAARIGVDATLILDSMNWHMHHFPCCKGGIALPHARINGGPVISCSMGVFANGIPWSPDETARLVLLFVAPVDAPNTYLAYLAQAARVFRDEEALLALLRSRQPHELVHNMRLHEIRLGSPMPLQVHTRVLVVESLADEPTLRRDRKLNQEPRMEGVHVQFFYACSEMSNHALVFDGREFLTGLRARIAALQPKYVLFHTGMAFRQFRAGYYDAILQLRRDFEQVRFGYQKSAGVEIDAGVFSNDPETRAFQSAFFPRYY